MRATPHINQAAPLGRTLAAHLGGATHLDVAVAYVKESGTKQLLRSGLPPNARFLVGIGFGLTDPSAVEDLVLASAEVRLFLGGGDHRPESFHPKLYMIRQPGVLVVLSGSANLTGAGLGDNVEQFEEFVLKSTEGRAHRARFQTLWEMGTPMMDAGSAWARYKEVHARIARSRQRHEKAARAFTEDVARRRQRLRAKRPPERPPKPGDPYAPRGYGSLRANEARTATEFQRKFPSLNGVRVGTTGAFDGTTQPAVHAALKAKHAKALNDNQVRDLHVLIIGKRPGENKLKQARLDKAFLLPFEEARKLTFLKRLA